MPTITVLGKTINCSQGDNLRQVLLANDIPVYNGNARYINCRGIGSCGTCAVEIEGEVSPPNWKDRTRRSLPPHAATKNLRLACQTEVIGDLHITKYDCFWGQGREIVWKS